MLRRKRRRVPEPVGMPRILTGGTPDEQDARLALLQALGPGWRLEFEQGRDGECLRLYAPDGDHFEVQARELHLVWSH